MRQIAGHKLHTRHRLGLDDVAVGAVFPGEGDVGVGDREDARIADGRATEIGAEIFDGILTVAKGLEPDTPVRLPDAGIDGRQRMGRGQLSKPLLEGSPESGSQDGLGCQVACEIGLLSLEGRGSLTPISLPVSRRCSDGGIASRLAIGHHWPRVCKFWRWAAAHAAARNQQPQRGLCKLIRQQSTP